MPVSSSSSLKTILIIFQRSLCLKLIICVRSAAIFKWDILAFLNPNTMTWSNVGTTIAMLSREEMTSIVLVL